MRNKKFCWIFILSLLYLLIGCNKNSDIGQFDDAVVESESNQNKFEQITFTISVINNSNEYLNTGQIDSIKLKVNGKDWGTFKSERNDTTSNTNKIENNIKFSYSKISYLVIAPYILKTDNLETAGDFVDYLNDRIVLTPGDYICEVFAIKFRDIRNQWITFNPQVYKDFKVVENTSSSYVGDITVIIK